MRYDWRACLLCSLLACLLLAGCPGSSEESSNRSSGETSTKGANADDGTTAAADRSGEGWPEYPDVPFVPIMEEVDGIPIPRFDRQETDFEAGGEVPVDVGNEFAKAHPGEPTTGGWLTIRLSSEPESLNPIVETSAVQTYIMGPVSDALATQDPETFEFLPKLAREWVIEDSIKLAPDYPGQERRIAQADADPALELEVTYAAGDDEEPLSVEFQTSDAEGSALGEVWVGLMPVNLEEMPGVPTTGYHYWSDEEGKLSVSGVVDGTYRVLVGAEIYGKATRNDDGSITVRAATEENPLTERLASDGNDALELAEGEWIDIQEQTVFTYYLRDEAAWSDGSPFTSQDLEFGYAVINNPYVDGESLRIYYQDLTECTPLGPQTVRMRYRQQYFKAFDFTYGLAAYSPPWHLFEQFFAEEGKTLTMEPLTPQEEDETKQVSVHGQQFGKFFNTDPRYNERPLGTGPYTVGDWERADKVEVLRNEDYWDTEDAGYLDRIIFKFIPDSVTAMQALRAGEIDFFYGMEAEQFFEDLKGPPDWFKGRYVKASWYSPGFAYVGWNMLRPKFQDRRVRLALKLLFDTEEYVEKKIYGEAVIVSGSQYFFGPGNDPTLRPIGYDPEAAADLLADAGWVDTDNDGILDKDGEPFEFEYLLPPGSTAAEEQAQLIQRNLKQAGIRMEVRTFEWASFIEKLRSKDFDACRLGWAQPLESDPYQIWHGSQAGADKRGSNHVSFSDPLADELIEMLRLTLDEEKRKRIHWSFQRILDREQPYMFLYTSKDFGAYHQRFQGVKWYALRPGFDLREWYVPKDQQQH
ncbi:MAG: ABC transporter substrate-binding protein [Planctomycetota bacterium]|nr:MAG: ABC transporter substrate-binding protein [Planctomycetota bacterium]REK20189.1 MAG: ABC transporter substrate-binding protein [Planctomycetota bacterium]REK35429.1 MAG: ABC transporter substrate-binding protein [Planctomycetota bacterium]